VSVFVGYLGRLALLWGAIIAAAYMPSAPLRWMTALLLSLSAYAMLVFEQVTLQFLTYDSFITMMNSGGSFGDALQQNQAAFIRAAGPGLALFMAIGLSPRTRF
jgi:hypothetical protein